jgi:hypothetical protein
MPPEPPPGWALLQERAHQAKDPHELAQLIDEMNTLLAEYEISSGDIPAKKPRRVEDRKLDKKING